MRTSLFTRPLINRISTFRLKAHLSQQQVAFLLGHKTTAQISRWENGVKIPSLKSVITLAVIFQMPVETLFPDLTDEIQDQVRKRKEELGIKVDPEIGANDSSAQSL